MSFILDALKKSENERQRQVGPSLADAPAARRKHDKPWWAFAVAALLVINLGVLLIVLTRDGDAKPVAQPPKSTAVPITEPAQPQPAQQYIAPPAPRSMDRPAAPPSSPAVRSLADEAGGYGATDPYNAGPASAASVPAGPPVVRPIQAPAVAPASIAPPNPAFASRNEGGTAGGSAAQPVEMLPTLNDLTASGTSMPELHLDIHVNSNNAAERFVFVNMRKYTEGQILNEGPTIERITADGVVLNQRGLRFLLPRQTP